MRFQLADLFGLNAFFAAMAAVYSFASQGDEFLAVVVFVHAAGVLVPFAIGLLGLVIGKKDGQQLRLPFQLGIDSMLRFALYCWICVGLFWLFVVGVSCIGLIWLLAR